MKQSTGPRSQRPKTQSQQKSRGSPTAQLEELVKAAARRQTNRIYRTVSRWLKEIEVLIITGTTAGTVEANNTASKNIKQMPTGTATRQL